MSALEVFVSFFAVMCFLAFTDRILLLFKEKSEPVDTLTHLSRLSRKIGVQMEIKLENGKMVLHVIKPGAVNAIAVELFEFDNEIRRLKKDRMKAIAFVKNVTAWSHCESKEYVERLM